MKTTTNTVSVNSEVVLTTATREFFSSVGPKILRVVDARHTHAGYALTVAPLVGIEPGVVIPDLARKFEVYADDVVEAR